MGNDRGRAAVKGEVGKIHLRQDQDDGEQSKLEEEECPTPSLHETPAITQLSKSIAKATRLDDKFRDVCRMRNRGVMGVLLDVL